MRPDSPSAFKGKKGLKRVLNAARYSYDGFSAAWLTESAFRQICWLGLFGAVMLVMLPIDRQAWALIIASHFFSMAVELLNSAIEAAVDHSSLEVHPLAKRAKDMGSAAQFVCLVNLAAVWCLALFDSFF